MTPSVLVGSVLFAVVLGGLDRLRGMDLPGAAVRKLVYGLMVGGYIAHTSGAMPLTGVLYGALFALGSAPGWGNPVGRALINRDNHPHSPPERWQVGPLRDNVPLALAARGAMWTAPGLLVLPLHMDWLIVLAVPAMSVAFLAAPYMARAVLTAPLSWSLQEFLRGLLFGLLLVVAGSV
jgi:hypothetical protein